MDRSSTRDSRPPNEVMAERSGLSTVGRQSSTLVLALRSLAAAEKERERPNK